MSHPRRDVMVENRPSMSLFMYLMIFFPLVPASWSATTLHPERFSKGNWVCVAPFTVKDFH